MVFNNSLQARGAGLFCLAAECDGISEYIRILQPRVVTARLIDARDGVDINGLIIRLCF